MNSALVVAGVGTLMLFAACGTSEPVADTSAPVVTDAINYAEGAFIPSGSGSTDGGPALDDTAPSDTAPSDTAPSDTAPSDTAPGTDATGATTTTTTSITTTTTAGDPNTAGSTSVPAGGSAGSSTSVPAGGATTTVAPSGSSGTNEGIVRIGTVDYPFKAETCDVDELGFSVLGYGTSSTGQPVEVDMSADTVDLDGDGTVDINFDIFVVPNVDSGVDISNLPDFYASKVETASFSEGDDIVVTVIGTQINGSGPIEDFNEVAVPDGQTLLMTFEVRCA